MATWLSAIGTLVSAKGDLIAATGADTVTNVPVGTDGQILTADAASAGGVKWAAASSGAATKSVTVLGDGSGNVNITADNTYRDLSTTWAQVSIAAAVGDKLQCNFDFEWYRSAASGNGTLCVQFSVGGTIRDPWFTSVDSGGQTRHESFQCPLITVASGDIVSGLVTVKIRVAGPTSNPQVTIFNEAGPTSTIYKRRSALTVVNLGAL